MVKGVEVVNDKEHAIKNIFSLNYLLEEMGIDYIKQ